MSKRLPISVFVISIALAAAVERQAAAQTDQAAMRLEVIGAEITPVSVSWGTSRSGAAPTRFQPGLGGTLRLGKFRWPNSYFTLVRPGTWQQR